MNLPLFRLRRPIGVAIGPTIVLADLVPLTETVPWSRSLAPLGAGDIRWPALTAAFQELRAAAGVGAEVAVALMPPLVDLRVVTLPPLEIETARQAISRNAAQYFLAGQEPQVIAMAPGGTSSRVRTGAQSWVVAAAVARIVEAIYAAAADAGLRVRVVVPAEAAWCAAARTIWPSLRQEAYELVVTMPERTEILSLEQGALAGVRRSLGQAMGLSARRGDTLVAAPAVWQTLTASPIRAAATFAAKSGGFEFLSESLRRLRQSSHRKLTIGMAAAALLLLTGAAGLELWGVRRELDHFKHARAALRPKVAVLAATRDLAAATRGRLDELAAINRTAVSWSKVLVTLVETMPQEAHLVAIRASGDSLVLEGLAERASDVFRAIESAPELTAVQSAAPVRRDLRDRADSLPPERFSIAARVRGTPTGPDSAVVLTAARKGR